MINLLLTCHVSRLDTEKEYHWIPWRIDQTIFLVRDMNRKFEFLLFKCRRRVLMIAIALNIHFRYLRTIEEEERKISGSATIRMRSVQNQGN